MLQAVEELEQQLAEAREQLVQANQLRKQQLVELGLLREEEKHKLIHEHDSQVDLFFIDYFYKKTLVPSLCIIIWGLLLLNINWLMWSEVDARNVTNSLVSFSVLLIVYICAVPVLLPKTLEFNCLRF